MRFVAGSRRLIAEGAVQGLQNLQGLHGFVGRNYDTLNRLPPAN